MRLDFCKPQKKAIAQTIHQVQQSKHSAPAWCSAALAYLAITATPASAQSNEEADSKAIEEITVTAQKIEESIQDVPIAVSAISGDTMGDLKIERGDELVRAVPNVNFSKANFSTYNFAIRGVGTKAISASTDPAVAVSFNNASMIRNRLYEQEFFDVQRVEVLRGPQGTLYGRNATAGVVNMLPQMPTQEFESNIKGEVGSYNTRRTSAMLNVPLGDTLAMRFSGAMTQRDGYDYNAFTDNDVNDRDLYSSRLILQWQPSEVFSANLIWQHFEEDDKRSRTGKQLCTRDTGPDMVGEAKVSDRLKPQFSQGCLPGSLYDGDAFGAPNAEALAFLRVTTYGLGGFLGLFLPTPDNPYYTPLPFVKQIDPYRNVQQSRDLREIETSYDPVFRAENDVAQLNLELALGESLRLFAQSTYTKDDYYSSQDYNRYLSAPVFNDSAEEGLFGLGGKGPNSTFTLPGITPGGVFTDPQLGPSDRMLSVDISQSDNSQWSHELRLQSAFDGPFNFSLGANYLDFESQDDYYVFNNLFTHIAIAIYGNSIKDEEGRNTHGSCDEAREGECIYVDPNSLEQLNEEGHNYFLSRNLVETRSRALFGETYWQMTDAVKLTAGLRYTEDRKTATPIPSQLLLGTRIGDGIVYNGGVSGGKARRGYPRGEDIKQAWREYTGRLVLDWRTETPFTDETLFYASFSHGYKGGGSNPPRVDVDPAIVQYQPLAGTFEPEFVNAFEFGAKNTLLDGSLNLNATAFYYDYKDYQVSQIVDRISFNENFDTETWGLELESAWQITPNTRTDFNLGYLKTRIGDGEESIDVMNRTQGNADWVLVRPTFQVPSNCIAPRQLVEKLVAQDVIGLHVGQLCGGALHYGTWGPIPNEGPRHRRLDKSYGVEPYDPLIDAPNGGRGFAADIGGNELPNAPRFTANLGLEHVIQVMDWDLKLRADYYHQGESYARVYNTEYDRLEAWSNLNVSATFTQPEWDLQMQLYVKNVFDDAPITDFFTNSDDTGLSTNVFTLDPRIVGLSLYKGF